MTRPAGPFTTRPIEPSDFDVLGAWLEDAAMQAPAGLANWQRILDEPRIVCRIAVDAEGRRCGFFRLDVAPDRRAELTVVVAARGRRVGAGAALLAAAIELARDLGLARLDAMLDADNSVARAFFLAGGFEPVDGPPLRHHVHFARIVHSAGQSVAPLEITP